MLHSDLTPETLERRPTVAPTIESCRTAAETYVRLAAEAPDGFERSIMIQIADRLRRLANHKKKAWAKLNGRSARDERPRSPRCPAK